MQMFTSLVASDTPVCANKACAATRCRSTASLAAPSNDWMR